VIVITEDGLSVDKPDCVIVPIFVVEEDTIELADKFGVKLISGEALGVNEEQLDGVVDDVCTTEDEIVTIGVTVSDKNELELVLIDTTGEGVFVGIID